MPKIIMYKTPICPYCDKAMNLLKNKNVAEHVEALDITKNPALLKEMLEKSGGRKTVPQIFINDQHIGGCDDLYALDDNGELDKLLK
ncbi:MAG: glutaredoxin 3 [Rickettsiales bacterium]|nr:glutaredoxin 3 [Rickettsiales bacterium]